MGGDLEPPPAARAVHEVVHSIEVIAELGEERAVTFVSAAGHLLFLRPPQPFDLIVIPVPALRARERHRLHLGLFCEAVALIQSHP